MARPLPVSVWIAASVLANGTRNTRAGYPNSLLIRRGQKFCCSAAIHRPNPYCVFMSIRQASSFVCADRKASCRGYPTVVSSIISWSKIPLAAIECPSIWRHVPIVNPHKVLTRSWGAGRWIPVNCTYDTRMVITRVCRIGNCWFSVNLAPSFDFKSPVFAPPAGGITGIIRIHPPHIFVAFLNAVGVRWRRDVFAMIIRSCTAKSCPRSVCRHIPQHKGVLSSIIGRCPGKIDANSGRRSRIIYHPAFGGET